MSAAVRRDFNVRPIAMSSARWWKSQKCGSTPIRHTQIPFGTTIKRESFASAAARRQSPIPTGWEADLYNDLAIEIAERPTSRPLPDHLI